MSIASEITRLQGVKADILQAIADKGVTVPADSTLADCPDLIASISTSGGGGGGGGGQVIPGLPSNYTPINAIRINQTSSSQLLKFENLNFSTDGVSFYFEVKKNTSISAFCGLFSISGQDIYFTGYTGQIYVFANGGRYSNKYITDSFQEFIVKNSSNKWYVNGSYSEMSGTFNVNNFAVTGSNNSNISYKRIKIFKHENNTDVVYLDLFPVKDENEIVGFYDLVQSRFLTSPSCSEET
jgi:hypothetical protein